MLCARRTVLLARRHHSFSSSHICSDVARAEDFVAECRSRVKEAEEAEAAAVRDLRDVLRSPMSHQQAHDHSTGSEHRVAETRRAVEAELEPMRHRLSKMSRSLDELLHKTEQRHTRDFHQRGGFPERDHGELGGFRSERGRFRSERGGCRERDFDHGERGELRGERGGFHGERGGFRGERGELRGERGGCRERDFDHGERGGFRGERGGRRGMRHWRGRGRGGRLCFRKFVAFMLVAGLLYASLNLDREKCLKALKEHKENLHRSFGKDPSTETK